MNEYIDLFNDYNNAFDFVEIGTLQVDNQINNISSTNQQTFGPTNQITLNVNVSGISTITLPNPGIATADIVLTESDQIINGNKTLTGITTSHNIIPDSNNTRDLGSLLKNYANFYVTNIFGHETTFTRINLTDLLNQITFGVGPTITINSNVPISNRTYTLKDVLSNADFIMSVGTQTMDNKTLTNSPSIQVTTINSTNINNVSNNINAPGLTQNGGNMNIISSSGVTAFSNSSPGISQIQINRLGVNDWGLAICNAGNDIITGTSSGDLAMYPQTNTKKLFCGIGSSAYFSGSTTSFHVIPSTTATSSTGSLLVEGGLCVKDNMFLQNSLNILASSNHIILGIANPLTLSSTALTSARTYTISDAGKNTSFVLTDSAQTINDIKTFSGTMNTSLILPITNNTYDIGSSSFRFRDAYLSSSAKISSTSNQILFGTGTSITTLSVTSPPAFVSLTHTVPYVGVNSNFILSNGVNSISGVTTFTSNTASNSQTTGTVVVQGGIGCSGVSYINSVKFNTSGGTPTSLDYYEEFTLTNRLAGALGTANPSCNLVLKRIGTTVFCSIPSAGGIASATAVITATTNLPTRFLPVADQYIVVHVQNSSFAFGVLLVPASGASFLTWYSSAALGNFTIAGACAIRPCMVQWSTN